jgi:hypothetical protein
MRSWLAISVIAAGCSMEISAGRVERCALGLRSDVIGDVEATVGHPFQIERTYHRIDDVFPTPRELDSIAQGHTLLASIKPSLGTGGILSWARIANPDDSEAAARIGELALHIRDFGQPIFLIFHDEANQDSVYGTPAEYVSAWQRVVETFRGVGADNVTWIWTLSSSAFPSQADEFYPGDAWVDQIAATGFNWYTGDPVSQWRTFASVFASFFEWAAPLNKPLVIASTASGENPAVSDDSPKSKATWIREALETVKDTPQIQALVWYDDAAETNPYKNWRIDSSAASLDAFRELSADPHFEVSALTPPR